MTTTHIIRHYKANPDGTLRFVGNETVKVWESRTPRKCWHTPDNETLRRLGEIAYDGRVNPNDEEM